MLIKGTVVHGRGVGKTFGFPTANIETSKAINLEPGVYSSIIEINNKRFLAVVNIGSCPTFDIKKETIEAFIIDFDGDIYNNNVTLSIKNKIRDIKRFENIEDLKKQIADDVVICTKSLENI